MPPRRATTLLNSSTSPVIFPPARLSPLKVATGSISQTCAASRPNRSWHGTRTISRPCSIHARVDRAVWQMILPGRDTSLIPPAPIRLSFHDVLTNRFARVFVAPSLFAPARDGSASRGLLPCLSSRPRKLLRSRWWKAFLVAPARPPQHAADCEIYHFPEKWQVRAFLLSTATRMQRSGDRSFTLTHSDAGRCETAAGGSESGRKEFFEHERNVVQQRGRGCVDLNVGGRWKSIF